MRKKILIWGRTHIDELLVPTLRFRNGDMWLLINSDDKMCIRDRYSRAAVLFNKQNLENNCSIAARLYDLLENLFEKLK